jgi:4-amino-4-deoxy-L-arabinose transferase-like glycosyltransferase
MTDQRNQLSGATQNGFGFYPSLKLAALLIGALTLLRIVALFASPLNLGPDEAQYWHWSTEFAFGYFSKPPLIAWLIGATTAVCGDGEGCVRLSSPIMHAATSLILYQIGARLFSVRVGFWSAVTFATLPSVSFSSGLISTDAPLLAAWACALLSFHQLMETKEWRWAIALGIALGVGLLAKYAMGYFILCAIVYALIASERVAPVWPQFTVALVLGALIFAPNLVWNAWRDFPTIGHTAANANLGGDLFSIGKMFEFAISQVGVFGPVLLIALGVGIFRCIRTPSTGGRTSSLWYLLAFSAPILIIALTIAFISRANANWAATAYVAATPIAIVFLLDARKKFWLAISMSLHASLAILFAVGFMAPAAGDAIGLSSALKQVRGWEAFGSAVLNEANRNSYTSISTDERDAMGALLYYARPRSIPVTMWDHHWPTRNHYEMTARITQMTGGNTLFVTGDKDPAHIYDRFQSVAELGPILIDIGGAKTRAYYMFHCVGFQEKAVASVKGSNSKEDAAVDG